MYTVLHANLFFYVFARRLHASSVSLTCLLTLFRVFVRFPFIPLYPPDTPLLIFYFRAFLFFMPMFTPLLTTTALFVYLGN